MPNTNPADLDREALRLAYAAYEKAFPDAANITYDGLRAGIRAYLNHLLSASGVPEAEAVAWRWRQQSWDVGIWALSLNPKTAPAKEFIVEPLYASSPPVAAPSGEAEAVALTYRNYRGEVAVRNVKPISVRYGSTEWHPRPQWLLLAFDCDKQAEREFALEDIGASYPPIASEPKDAGSGEGHEINGLGLIKAVTAYDQYWENHDDASEAVRCAIEAYLAFTRTAPSGAKP